MDTMSTAVSDIIIDPKAADGIDTWLRSNLHAVSMAMHILSPSFCAAPVLLIVCRWQT